MKSTKTGLQKFLFLLIIIGISFSASAQDAYMVTFPLNDYLKTTSSSPYPDIIKEKVNKIPEGKFINVMDFGAVGNGQKADDAAIAAAFAARKEGTGVLFPPGKTFLIKNLITIAVTYDLKVVAAGAVFKMDANTGSNAIALECSSPFTYDVLWVGGTFDGNKDQQSWPGSPTKNDEWSVSRGNYGLLTIRQAKFALVSNVHLKNTVYDGIDLYECKLGVFANSDAEGGAPLNYSAIRTKAAKGRQATYFKTTRILSEAVYFLNLTCSGGSIGIQYSTPDVGDNSLAVVNNCKFLNQFQDAIHFEHCKKVFIYKTSVSADNATDYHADVHLSNSTEVASIKESQFRNGRVDFRNAKSLKLGLVESCSFEAVELQGRNTVKQASLGSFIFNATNINKCTFKGRTMNEQVKASYISESTFNNFSVATNAAKIVYQSKFNNGETAISNAKNESIIVDNTFNSVNTNNESNVKNVAFKKQNNAMARRGDISMKNPQDDSWKDALKKTITVVDKNNKNLGVL